MCVNNPKVSKMKLFELRACWSEYFDDSDYGNTLVCECHETIAFTIDDETPLIPIRDDLIKGFRRGAWSESRAKHLRKLYPGFDCMRDTDYRIIEVTGLIVAS